MSRRSNSGPPQIDFTSWLLGGNLVTRPTRPKELIVHVKPKSTPAAPTITAKKVSNGAGKANKSKTIVKNNDTKDDFKEKDKAEEEKKDEAADSPKEDKKIEEKEPEEKTAEQADNSTPKTSSSTDIEWTKEQDNTIIRMKADGKTWVEIATSVGNPGKKAVLERYKFLTRIKESSSIDTNTNTKANEIEANSQDPKDKGHSKNNHNNVNKFNGKDKDTPSQDQTQKPDQTPETKEKNSESGPVKAVEDIPPLTKLEPDGIWTREDCEILQLLESRYREHKWLQMQADFYNMTGRMVSGELIKAKFGV